MKQKIDPYNPKLNNNSNTAIIERGSFEGRIVEQEELDVIEGRAVASLFLTNFYVSEKRTKEILNKRYMYTGREKIPEGYQTPLQGLVQLNPKVFDFFCENPQLLLLYVRAFQKPLVSLLAGYESFKRLTHALNAVNIGVLEFFVKTKDFPQLNDLDNIFQFLIEHDFSLAIFNKIAESNYVADFFENELFYWPPVMEKFTELAKAQLKIASAVKENIVTILESGYLFEILELLQNECFAGVPLEHLDSVLKDEACFNILTLASTYSIFLNALKDGILLATKKAGFSPAAEQVLQVLKESFKSTDEDILLNFLLQDRIKAQEGNEICQNFQTFFELLQNHNPEVFNFLCENPPFLLQVLDKFLPAQLRKGYGMHGTFKELTETLLSLDLNTTNTQTTAHFRQAIFKILFSKILNKHN